MFIFSKHFFFENLAVCEIMWKNIVHPESPHMTVYSACALHAGNLRLQTHTQNMYYSLLSHCSNGYMNAPQCCVIRTLLVMLGRTSRKQDKIFMVRLFCMPVFYLFID
jgi:hypothetical protein